MALRTPNRLEIGQRVRWLRKQADYSGRALASAIGATDTGIMTKIEKHGDSLDIERVVRIANACAGRGPIIEDEKLVYDFLMGFVEDPRMVLRPTLSLVPPVNEAGNDGLESASPGSNKGRSLSLPADSSTDKQAA